jgi:hypothetical protein
MPTKKFSSSSPVATSERQFLHWLHQIQMKFLDAVNTGYRFSFDVGSRDCRMAGVLMDRKNMAKYLTNETRSQKFFNFLDRLEAKLGLEQVPQEERKKTVRTLIFDLVPEEPAEAGTSSGFFGDFPET